MSCKIVFDKQGKAEVFNEDGTRSILFERAMTFHENEQEEALNTWAVSQLDEFKELYPDSKPTLEQVQSFVELSNSEIAVMNASEFLETRSLIDQTGSGSLSNLYSRLVEIFKPEGHFNFNPQKAVESGIYTRDEVDNLDYEKVAETLEKMEGQLRYSDIVVEPTLDDYEFINSEETTLIGTYKRVTDEEVSKELLELSDKIIYDAEFANAVEQLPYRNLAEQILNDENFEKKVKGRLSKVSDIPNAVVRDGQVRLGFNPKFEEVRAFILRGFNTTNLRARFNVMNNLLDYSWTQEREIKALIKKNVNLFAEANVDLIGLEESWQDRQAVTNLFASAIEMLENPSDTNIQNFVEMREQILGETTLPTKQVIAPEYQGLSIARVYSSLSDSELFNTYGLIKIGDNLYHKVDLQDSKDDLYEMIYQMYVDGRLEIPREFQSEKDFKNPANKTNVLYDLEAFVASRNTGIVVQDNELLSLFQVAFNHQPIPQQNPARVSAMVTSALETVEAIRDGFMPAFYNYYLEEKQARSEVYQNVLSKFAFTEKGMVMHTPIQSIASLREDIRLGLEDYIKLRRDSDMDYLLGQDIGDVATEDAYFINNPHKIPNVTGKEMFLKGKYLMIANSLNTYAKVGDRLFRKVLDTDSTTLYQEIFLEQDPLFYSNNLNFEFDLKEAQQFLKEHKLVANRNTAEQNKQALKEAKFNPTTRNQIIGERAILPQELNDSLEKAKQLQKQGLSPLQIEMETGWFQEYGQWKYFSKETLEGFKLKPNIKPEANQEYQLKDVIDNKSLFNLYPSLAETKVIFYDKTTEGISEHEATSVYGLRRGGVIYLNSLRDIRGYESLSRVDPRFEGRLDVPSGQETLSGEVRAGTEFRDRRFDTQVWMSTLAHEVAHEVQERESFPQGGSARVFESVTRSLLPGISNEGLGKARQFYLDNIESVPLNDRPFVEAYLDIVDSYIKGKPLEQSAYQKYMLLVGEADARTLEYILNSPNIDANTTFQEFRDLLLAKEGLFGQPLIPYRPSTPKEVISTIQDRLKQNGLSKNIHTLSPTRLQEKLKELGVNEETMKQIIAWHGSPHQFNRFTTDAIGTGEGAQAFGWGLYFTDLESIARAYAKKLAGDEFSYDGKPISKYAYEYLDLADESLGENFNERTIKPLATKAIKMIKEEYIPDLKEIQKTSRSQQQRNEIPPEIARLERVVKELEDIVDSKEVTKLENKYIYKTVLFKDKTPDQYNLLEWDRPIKPSVANRILEAIDREGLRGKFDEGSLIIQRALAGARGGGTVEVARQRQFSTDLWGAHVYEKIQKIIGSAKETSLFLLRAGIDGMKYPAERVSRGATSDTARGFNYVIFDESAVTVEEVAQFQKVLSEKGITLVPQGFVHNNEVYLNEEAIDPVNTLIHEHGHLFNTWAKENRPEIYQRGLELIQEQGQEYLDFVKRVQPNLEGEALLEEALTQAIGDKGAKIVDSKRKSSITQWLNDLWQSIKESLGITQYTAEQLQDLNLQQFAEAVSIDLLSGETFSPTKTITIGQRQVQVKTLPDSLDIVDGWYSPIEKAVIELKQERGTANQFLAQIQKSKGVKKDELQYTGVENFLQEQGNNKITKQDILDYMRDNRIEIVEVVKGKIISEEFNQETYDDIKYQLDDFFDGEVTHKDYIKGLSLLNDWKVNPSNTNFQNIVDFWNEQADFMQGDREDLRIDSDNQSLVSDNTKYSQYQLEGEKSNYKEVLVTLPEKRQPITKKVIEDGGQFFVEGLLMPFDSREKAEKYIADTYEGRSKPVDNFRSSHFDEPNILVHLRMNTRTDVNGNKILFLEELQSDWGQEGKKEGFITVEDSKVVEEYQRDYKRFNELSDTIQKLGKSLRENEDFQKAKDFISNAGFFIGVNFEGDGKRYLYKERPRSGVNKVEDSDIPVEVKNNLKIIEDISKDYKEAEEEQNLIQRKYGLEYTGFGESRLKPPAEFYKTGVPSSPFVTDTSSWVKLGLKTAIKEAVNQGADKISWTTGEQQADRYDLSKQVDRIDVESVQEVDNLFFVDITLPNGVTENLEVENGIIREGNYQGQRLEDVIGKEYTEKVFSTPKGETQRLEGEGLKMGGKGMKVFYDKIVPKEIRKVVKDLTGKDGVVGEVLIPSEEGEYNPLTKKFYGKHGFKVETYTQQSIDITPELRNSVQQGVPLFQQLPQPIQPTVQVDPEVSKNFQSIFNSRVKILDLYTENEQQEIDQKVEDCGG